jgi:hypothetical protein
MAKRNVGLGVELFAGGARLVLLEETQGALKVRATETLPSAASLATAYRGLAIRPSSVVCAVSLGQAAVRVLELPPVNAENVERVVALEAETALPMEEELALSHHVIGMTEQSRLEVLLAASKLSSVKETLAQVNAVPWVSTSVTVTPVALMNAMGAAARTGTPVAVLRIEADGSELVVLDRERVITGQVIPIGCRASTLDATAPAGEDANAGPPWVGLLAREVRFALQAISYERGTAFTRLWVCGAGAANSKELAWATNMSVEALRPHDVPEIGAEYAVAAGCALQAVGRAQVALNMTPARLTMAREVAQRQQGRLSWTALATAVLVTGALLYLGALHNQSMAIEASEQKLKMLAGVKRVVKISPSDLKKSQVAVQTAIAARVPAAEMLAMLSTTMPQDAWLAEFNYNGKTGGVVRGYSMQPDGAQQTQAALLRRQQFDEVTLDYRTEESLSGVPVWGFQLTCRLRPQAAIATTRRTGL